MSFYMRPEYFEVIHYYYFFIGMFSFICAIFFGYSAVYSVMFITLYVGLSAFSWYVSWFMNRKMREFVIPNSLGYAARHVFLTLLGAASVYLLWHFNVLNEEVLVSSILQVNYSVLFLALLWYLIIRFGFVKALFEVYDSRTMERAKRLIIRTRQARKDVFTRIIISDGSIQSYRNGSNPEVDELLMAAWRERNSGGLLRRITQMEIALCTKTVQRLRMWISDSESKDVVTPRERETINRYKQAIEEYGRLSVEYEKNVVPRVPAD